MPQDARDPQNEHSECSFCGPRSCAVTVSESGLPPLPPSHCRLPDPSAISTPSQTPSHALQDARDLYNEHLACSLYGFRAHWHCVVPADAPTTRTCVSVRDGHRMSTSCAHSVAALQLQAQRTCHLLRCSDTVRAFTIKSI
jgi:hypothetical protein